MNMIYNHNTVQELSDYLKKYHLDTIVNMSCCYKKAKDYYVGKDFITFNEGTSNIQKIINVLSTLPEDLAVCLNNKPINLRMENKLALFTNNIGLKNTTYNPHFITQISEFCNENYSNCSENNEEMKSLVVYLNKIDADFTIYYVNKNFYCKSLFEVKYPTILDSKEFSSIFYMHENCKKLYICKINEEDLNKNPILNYLELQKLRINNDDKNETIKKTKEMLKTLPKEEILEFIKDTLQYIQQ